MPWPSENVTRTRWFGLSTLAAQHLGADHADVDERGSVAVDEDFDVIADRVAHGRYRIPPWIERGFGIVDRGQSRR